MCYAIVEDDLPRPVPTTLHHQGGGIEELELAG